jgi:D-beta-D-heptose 7-phosphate kinase/D-beta-D-heptose 1-phosphate adenosyltransferase
MDDTLAQLPHAFAGKTVLVLGDVMLDRFIYGAVDRISPEAPVPVIAVERETAMLGGAGNVARNVAALGGQAVLIGLIGDDDAGRALDRHDRRGGRDRGPPGHRHAPPHHREGPLHLRLAPDAARRPRGSRPRRRPSDLLAAFTQRLPAADVVVLSDYAKGVLTDAVVPAAPSTRLAPPARR